MTDFADRRCEPCEGKTSPLRREEAEAFLVQLQGWLLSDDGRLISREYVCANFVAAVAFINEVRDIAEAENHHPDLHLTAYKRLRIELSTHAIGGLSENDFILAAKIDQLQT